MAKRKSNVEKAEHKIEEFAEDLGRILGTARGKAENWLGQRQNIVKQLTALRDEATKLLSDLGHQADRAVRRGRAASKEMGLAKRVVKRARRKMSAAARAKISAAQKKRWAKQKAGEKK